MYLLISSLPGKALRTLVDIARLAEQKLSNSTCLHKAEPGKIDIKTRTWYSIYLFTNVIIVETSDYDVIFRYCVDTM